jgi:hypothetical protein
MQLGHHCQGTRLLRGRNGSLVHSTCCCVGVMLMHLKSTWSLSCRGPSGCKLPEQHKRRSLCASTAVVQVLFGVGSTDGLLAASKYASGVVPHCVAHRTGCELGQQNQSELPTEAIHTFQPPGWIMAFGVWLGEHRPLGLCCAAEITPNHRCQKKLLPGGSDRSAAAAAPRAAACARCWLLRCCSFLCWDCCCKWPNAL